MASFDHAHASLPEIILHHDPEKQGLSVYQNKHETPDFGHDNAKEAVEGEAKMDTIVHHKHDTPDFGHDNAKLAVEGDSFIAPAAHHHSVSTPNFGQDSAKLALEGVAKPDTIKFQHSAKTPNFGVDRAGAAVTGIAENPVAIVTANHHRTPYGPKDSMSGVLSGTNTAPLSPRHKHTTYGTTNSMSDTLSQKPPDDVRPAHKHKQTPYGADDNVAGALQGKSSDNASLKGHHATPYGKSGAVKSMLQGEEPVENLKDTPVAADESLKDHKKVVESITGHHHQTPYHADDNIADALEGKPKNTVAEVISHHHTTPFGATDHVKKAVEGKPSDKAMAQLIAQHHTTPYGATDHVKKAVEGKASDKAMAQLIAHHHVTPGVAREAAGGGVDHTRTVFASAPTVLHSQPKTFEHQPVVAGYMHSAPDSKVNSRASSPPHTLGTMRTKAKELTKAVWHQPNSPAAGQKQSSGDGGIFVKPAKRGSRPADMGIF